MRIDNRLPALDSTGTAALPDAAAGRMPATTVDNAGAGA
jgi:hypothetical protein